MVAQGCWRVEAALLEIESATSRFAPNDEEWPNVAQNAVS
jgi:hypothetical protein